MKIRNDDWLDMDSGEWTEKEKKHISELIRLQGDTIKAQVEEITKLKDTLALSVINSHNLIDSTYEVMDNEIKLLRGLLERWLDTQEITMTATFYPGMMEKYESVISDTEKALK